MTYSKNNSEYYRILNVSPDSSWKKLRYSYKKQMQEFHPDRFKDGSANQIDAEKHIKSLNSAYHYFLKYHKENASLPPLVDPYTIKSPDDLKRSFKFEPFNTYNTGQVPKHGKATRYRDILIIVTLLLILSAFLLLGLKDININQPLPKHTVTNDFNSRVNSNHLRTSDKGSIDNINSEYLNPKIVKETIEHQSLSIPVKKYFTYGSSMSNVLDVQGIPDKSIDNIWFYGLSTITFKDGVVIDWGRHRDTPLFISVIGIKADKDRNENSNKESYLAP